MDAGHCAQETKERQRASGGREEQEGEQNRENKVGEESRRDIRTERERGSKGGMLLNLYTLPPLQSRFTLIMLP